MRNLRRSQVLAAASGALNFAMVKAPARAAQFVYKYGHDQTIDSCVHVRAVEMANNIKRETNGRLEIQIFPNSQLGSDPAMIAQVREGALQFSCQSGPVLSGIAPLAGIQMVPFAFKTERQAVGAMIGELGDAVRNEVAVKAGFHFFPVIISSGFNEITSSTHPIRKADDLIGFKLRTRDAAINVEIFKLLGAQVIPLSIGEVYTALQTHLVDGADNAYTLIENQRLYEVQKYLSVVDAMWGGQLFYCNGDAWRALPSDIQAVVEKNALIYGKRSVTDNIEQTRAIADKLRRQGLIFNLVDRESFQVKLAPWYTKAKSFYGPTMWGLLEKYSGKLG